MKLREMSLLYSFKNADLPNELNDVWLQPDGKTVTLLAKTGTGWHGGGIGLGTSPLNDISQHGNWRHFFPQEESIWHGKIHYDAARNLWLMAMMKNDLRDIVVYTSASSRKIRVITETDLGGDPDDQASLVRFLMYANEWDVEGIIVDRSPTDFNIPQMKGRHRYGDEQTAFEMVQLYLDAYGQVYPNLLLHADGWPTPTHLRAVTVAGHESTDDAVDLITAALLKEDPRPIWFSNWGSNGLVPGGGTTESNLKRALDRILKEQPERYPQAVARVRLVSLDGNAPGMNRQGEHTARFPLYVETGWPEKYGSGYGTRWYHRFQKIAGAEKADAAIGHGPLGALWTIPKEGDTWCFMYYIPTGLSDPADPTLGGWAGRYSLRTGELTGPNMYWNDEEDTFGPFPDTPRDNTVGRYHDAPRRDFKARMDWCVKPFDQANHPPVPTLRAEGKSVAMGILSIQADPGETIALNAAATDPDGDAVRFEYVVYPEAGTYDGPIRSIQADAGGNAELQVPSDAAGREIHVYLEATDNGSARDGTLPDLTRYCRLIIEVNQ